MAIAERTMTMDESLQYNKLAAAPMRVQSVSLTAGHRHLIDSMLARHRRVLILLGDRPARRQLRHALDYETRRLMLLAAYPPEQYPQLIIEKFTDVGNDEYWSHLLDIRVSALSPDMPVVLYGGRDSFIAQYQGVHDVYDVGAVASPSGTELRAEAALVPLPSSDFRAGCIYAVVRDYPVAYQAVDVAVLRREGGVWQVLLGKRHIGATKWHLIGGISDPDDETLEYTGARELYEETQVITEEADLQYVCSKKIRDWRYADGPDDIKTVLFLTTNWRGQPTLTPEMVELQWFNVHDATAFSAGNHVYLLQQLAQKIKRL